MINFQVSSLKWPMKLDTYSKVEVKSAIQNGCSVHQQWLKTLDYTSSVKTCHLGLIMNLDDKKIELIY